MGAIMKSTVVLAIFGALALTGCADSKVAEQQRRIVEDVRPLVESCKSGIKSAPLSIQGKVLVWDVRSNARSGAHDQLPAGLKAGATDGSVTLFFVVGTRDVKVGTYSVSGQPGYRQYVDICVVYWPGKRVAGMTSITSDDPRKRRPVQSQPEYGDPNEPIAKWIAGLPVKGSE